MISGTLSQETVRTFHRRGILEKAIDRANPDIEEEDRVALLTHAALDVMPRTREDLKSWVKDWLGFDVPDVKVCEDHCTPMDYLWALYADWIPGFERGAVVAARDSYKTLVTAIAEFLDLQFKNCDTIHAGAIDEQAKKCYQYLSGFLNRPYFQSTYLKNLRANTKMKGGATIQVRPCTKSQMNGQHAPKLRIDELDLASEDGLMEARGIPCTDPVTGTPPSVWYISSWKYAHGPVSRAIKQMKEDPTSGKIMKWCWKEATVQCPDKRSGTNPRRIYAKPGELIWHTDRDFRLLASELQTGFSEFQVFDGCLTCPLIASCRGDLKRAGGQKPIEDWIVKMNQDETDKEFWISQIDCLRPGRIGLACPNFTEENQTHVDYDPKIPCVSSNDYGFGHLDVTLVGQRLPGDHLLIFDERDVHQQDPATTAREYITYFGDKYHPVRHFCDPSAVAAIAAYKKRGIPAVRAPNDEEEGLRKINRLICSPKDGKRRLLVNYRCKKLIEQLETLRLKVRQGLYTDMVEDHGDDYYKALKYMVLGLFLNRSVRRVRRRSLIARRGAHAKTIAA